MCEPRGLTIARSFFVGRSRLSALWSWSASVNARIKRSSAASTYRVDLFAPRSNYQPGGSFRTAPARSLCTTAVRGSVTPTGRCPRKEKIGKGFGLS